MSRTEAMRHSVEAERPEIGPDVAQDAQPVRSPKSIVVPVDGTWFGEHALPLAVSLARRSGAEIRLVHVEPSPESARRTDWGHYDDFLGSIRHRERRDYLQSLQRRLARFVGTPVRSVLLDGDDIPGRICSVISASDADLIVLSHHARSPWERLYRPSVADRLIQRTERPLLLVRGFDAPVELSVTPDIDHILVPLDGTDRSKSVLPAASALAALTEAQLTLLHVMSRRSDDFDRVRAGLPQRWHGRYETASLRLDQIKRRLRSDSFDVESRIVVDDGPRADAILNVARTLNAGLIALTTRGRGRLSRLVWRSISDEVLRRSSCPILVVRSESDQGAKSPLPTRRNES